MCVSLKPRIIIIVFLLLTTASISHAADFSYEIYDPRDSSASDYLVATQNVTISAELDFVYWRPSNATEPHTLLFHFPFDKEIESAYFGLNTATFNWGTEAYTKIEGSKDGTTWITLKETGPPAANDGWNDGTYVDYLPSSLLGSKDLYFRVTLSVYRNGSPTDANTAQALRHRILTNSRTLVLEVDFKEASSNAHSMAAIIPLLLDGYTVAGRTENVDPVDIGGEGTKIIYAGQTYTGPTQIVPNTLVGIEKDGQYYLYHPAMGTGITFSEETNKRAFLYAMLTYGTDYDPTPTASDFRTKVTADPTVINSKKVFLPSGVYAEMDGVYGEITLTNDLSRWVAVKINRGGSSTIHYIAPKTTLTPDTVQIVKKVVNDVGSYSSDGNVFTFNALTVDSFEIFCAAARTTALNVVAGWPTYCDRAVNSDKALFVRLCVLDYFYVFFNTIRNVVSALSLLECFDAIIDMFFTMVDKSVLSTFTFDQRLQDAIDYESDVSLMFQAFTCASVLATGGTAEIGYSIWDFAKAFGDFVENVPTGMVAERYFDAYTYVKLVDLTNLEVQNPPTKTEYTEGEALDVSGTILRATYESSPFNDAIIRGFTYGTDGFDLETAITPDPGTTLTTSDDRIEFNTLYPDIRFLSYEDGIAILGVSQNPSISAYQPISVTLSTQHCANPVISNSISIPGYGGGYNVTLHFDRNFKMCTEQISDPDSINGQTTMFYFYKSDGSGTYSTPNPESSSRPEFANASVDTTYENLNISVSPLAGYNSSTYTYYTPETNFGFYVINYETDSESHTGDYLWLKFLKESGGSWQWTIINTEWLEADGSYDGNY